MSSSREAAGKSLKLFTEEELLDHARSVERKHPDKPKENARYILNLIRENGYTDSEHPKILEVEKIVNSLINRFSQSLEDDLKIERANTEELRKEIDNYYLRQQLVQAILEIGEIPKDPVETIIGVGFIDIADYSYLSKWLSPKENQAVLNGLYSAFNMVLRKRGGYLNKMEGDSLMFHYGGTIDPNTKDLENHEEIQAYIAKSLFHSCIEMQEICNLFNQADARFLQDDVDEETHQVLADAFEIISTLRQNLMFASSINALFQIRIRVGANIGDVSIGNFGPKGAKQWDIIGVPVIEAKRMEATAPIGGLRISAAMYEILVSTDVAKNYFNFFKKQARKLNGYFKNVTQKDVFHESKVILKDKKNVTFSTYSVLVNPTLPELIREQVNILLEKEESGADKIIEILKYNRGNKFVIQAIEDLFITKDISLRKDLMLKAIAPDKYEELYSIAGSDLYRTRALLNAQYTLFQIFNILGKYQDRLKLNSLPPKAPIPFQNIDQYIQDEIQQGRRVYKLIKKGVKQRTYFFNVVFPEIFIILKSSILEYQNKITTELESL